MEKLGSPHGGKLVNREPAGREREVLEHKIKSVKDAIKLDDRQMADLDLIAVGAFSPLEGFIGKADYDSVLQNMRLSSGLPFSIPITLAVEESEAAKLTEGEDVLLQDSSGKTVGVLHLEEKYKQDKEKEAQVVYRTTDTAHPGVKYLQDTGDILLGGKISLLERAPVVFGEYAFDPAESRAKFKENGWRRVVSRSAVCQLRHTRFHKEAEPADHQRPSGFSAGQERLLPVPPDRLSAHGQGRLVACVFHHQGVWHQSLPFPFMVSTGSGIRGGGRIGRVFTG